MESRERGKTKENKPPSEGGGGGLNGERVEWEGRGRYTTII